MRLKTRAIILCIIFFMFFISFKIMEPELDNPAQGDDSNYDSDDNIIIDNKLNVAVTPSVSKDVIEEIVQSYVEKYSFQWNASLSVSFSEAGEWVNSREIHPDDDPKVSAMLNKLATAKIVRAGLGYRGTQLKMTLTLEGGQRVAFKPRWYKREDVVVGKPYDGPDRHNGEIAAFHLNRILGFRRAPLVAGRVINMETDIRPVADDVLLDTFYYKNDNTCFYGKCLYCKGPETGVCAEGTQLEGAVVLWLPIQWKLKNWKHPWRRTYKRGVHGPWETDDRYCDKVRHTPPYNEGPRLLDLIDATVLDYLIGNADRHHYETFSGHDDSIMLMLDNAKSFGNPNHDERSILAPIYQCCSIRKSTWQQLDNLKGGALSNVLRQVLAQDTISPVLAEPHYSAIDRRLTYILDTINTCVKKRGSSKVFKEDIYSSKFAL